MTTKKKKKLATDSDEPETDDRSYLDKLTDLRTDVQGESAVTHLLDILIDEAGGDSVALAAEIADGCQADSARADSETVLIENDPDV